MNPCVSFWLTIEYPENNRKCSCPSYAGFQIKANQFSGKCSTNSWHFCQLAPTQTHPTPQQQTAWEEHLGIIFDMLLSLLFPAVFLSLLSRTFPHSSQWIQSVTVYEKPCGSHLRCTTAEWHDLQYIDQRCILHAVSLLLFTDQHHGQLLGSLGLWRERPSPAFTREKAALVPSSVATLNSPPAPPLCFLLTSPSHIRSTDRPIKQGKRVSTECSALAEKAESGADWTSSSTTRTADISQLSTIGASSLSLLRKHFTLNLGQGIIRKWHPCHLGDQSATLWQGRIPSRARC